VNDGLFVRWELYRNLRVAARCVPGGHEMRKQLSIRIHIKIDLAACFRAVAVLVYLLM
jgi:hypothetical protein